MNNNKKVRVGVAVLLLKNNKILCGKRKNSHGDGTYSFPGGHLEYGESIEHCARRELEEETGLQAKNIQICTFTNDIFIAEEKHYITIFTKAEYINGEPCVMEPDKMTEWNWYTWDNLPNNLFLPIQNLLQQNFNPFQ